MCATGNSCLIKVIFLERTHLLHASCHFSGDLLSVWDQVT